MKNKCCYIIIMLQNKTSCYENGLCCDSNFWTLLVSAEYAFLFARVALSRDGISIILKIYCNGREIIKYILYQALWETRLDDHILLWIQCSIQILAYANSCINPILYGKSRLPARFHIDLFFNMGFYAIKSTLKFLRFIVNVSRNNWLHFFLKINPHIKPYDMSHAHNP